MAFPQTRLSLIQRLADGGSEQDWQVFLKDYWGPVCRFAVRSGAPNTSEAEDIAALTFEVLWQNQLLVRWVQNRSARLRTLLCAVVGNVLSNRQRVLFRERRAMSQLATELENSLRSSPEEPDAFFAAWIEDMLQRSIESVAQDYLREGKGDYVRVLYGRICQRLKIAQVADALNLTTSDVDNFFRHARDRLSRKLQELVRQQIQRYCPEEQTEVEFAAEWNRVGNYLIQQGGLEDALRRAVETLDPSALGQNPTTAARRASTRLATRRAESRIEAGDGIDR